MSAGPQSVLGEDLAEMPQASYTPDIVGEIDGAQPNDKMLVRQEVAVGVCDVLIKHNDTRLALSGFAIECGIPNPSLKQDIREVMGKAGRSENGKEMVREIVTRMMALFTESTNPRLTVIATAFACQLPITSGKSETEVAKMFGLTRAAVSKEVRRVMDLYGIKQNRNTKSAAACKKYQEITHENHWRNQTAAQAARTALFLH